MVHLFAATTCVLYTSNACYIHNDMLTTITSPVAPASWILLISGLPTKRATERVQIWRKLKRYGALSLKSGGHLLPNSPANLEHFEWLAAAIRKFNGHASVIQVQSLDDLP